MATDSSDLAVTQAPPAFANQISALKQDLRDGKTVAYNALSPTGKQAAQALEEQGVAYIRADAKDKGSTIVTGKTLGLIGLLTGIVTLGHG